MLATGRVGLLSERQVLVIRQGETLNCPCSWLRGGFQVLSKLVPGALTGWGRHPRQGRVRPLALMGQSSRGEDATQKAPKTVEDTPAS